MATAMMNMKATGGQPELLSHEDLMDCVNEFITVTADARAVSERCRDYKDGKQWTEEQIRALKKRKQAPVVNNRIKIKHNGLLGLTALRKGDPKAFPRNVNADSGAAEAVSDGLRYVADKIALNSTFLQAADNFFCEGYCGVHIIAEDSPLGIDPTVDIIPWDRIFFDVHSTRHDFNDARSRGFVTWMDEEVIRERFPDVTDEVLHGPEINEDGTFEDKPKWFIKGKKTNRHLVATHYYEKAGMWYMCIYTGSGFLMEPQPSPWLNEFGQPECPLELVHAYIDREGNRSGELKDFLDLQDEINHRRSKALFLLSQRQTFGNKGAIQNIKAAKTELAKPDGHLEIGTGEFNKDFGILPTGDMAQGQFELLQEAKQEMDAQSFSAQLAGERQSGNLSGVAINRLQQAGIIELNMLFDNFAAFKLRVYKKIWHRIRQFWTEEKWVRVTDDQKSLKWVGFNVPVTIGEYLQEIMDDESKDRTLRLGASAKMIMLEQQGPEALQQVIMVKNRPVELDMDVILDESFDFINGAEEQLDAILKYGAQGQFDIVDLLEISNVNGKSRLIEKIERRRKEAAEMQATAMQSDPQAQYLMAKSNESAAAAKAKEQDAMQTAIENQLLQQHGVTSFKGSVSA